ncbi:hypothetical protein AB1Y20_015064 [Prymnesium parvum]|uniref:Uncharacterized protein n=1 Tax=Prymnesium parvum TaxID=97485 RepID=A0AB34JWR1_PRYPA
MRRLLLPLTLATLARPSHAAWTASAAVRPRRAAARLLSSAPAASISTPTTTLEQEAALAYGSALSLAWRADTEMLRSLLLNDVDVATPLWKTRSRDEYEEALLEVAGFFGARATPVLTTLSQAAQADGGVRLSWQLSVEWPNVWRSRINIVGTTVLSFSPAGVEGALPLVRSVRETWHQAPWEAFVKQVLPKARDLCTLWCSPTAEEIAQPVLQRGDGFELRRLPPMLVVQVETIESGELLYQEQAVVAPPCAYTGEVKRVEWYSTVSPGILERSLCKIDFPGGVTQIGQRRRWIMPLPARFGPDPSGLPHPDARVEDQPLPAGVVEQSAVQYVSRPSMTIAAGVFKAAEDLTRKLEALGRRVVKKQGKPVIIQMCYDLKYGYNSKKQLSMAIWLSVPKFLERNEVAVVVEDE